MKKYRVTITEKLAKVVEVEADSRCEAIDLVEKDYYSSEQIFDADNFVGVTFKAPREPLYV